jgi:hypothetical protein
MTQTTYNDNVYVDGSRDITQLTVEGHSTQNQPLEEWKNSAGSTLAQMTGDGRLQVGDDLGGATPDALLEVHRADTSTAKPKRGLHLLGRIAGALATVVQWSVHELELLGNGVVSTVQAALRARATYDNAANSSASGELRAADVEASIKQGQLKSLTGLNAAVTKTGGTVTTAYGVKVDDITAGGTNYALHTGQGAVRVGDHLEASVLGSAPATPPSGYAKLYPKTVSGSPKLFLKDASGVEQEIGSAGGMGINLLPNGSFEVWEKGTSTAPAGWTLTGASATVAREAATIKHGDYSAKLTRSGTDCHLSRDLYEEAGKTYARSRQFTIGAWVYATVASRARLRVNDGTTTTYSSYHTGNSTWQFLTVTVTLGAAASVFHIGLAVDTGNTSAFVDGMTLVEGAALANTSPTPIPFNDLPARVTLWMDEATVTSGTALQVDLDSSQMYQLLAAPVTPANGDTFTHSFWLRAGSYTFSVLGMLQSVGGKVDWYLDNVLIISGQNWYKSTNEFNHIKTATVTVIGDGHHLLKAVVNGKDASSSGYWYYFTKLWFKPSTD